MLTASLKVCTKGDGGRRAGPELSPRTPAPREEGRVGGRIAGRGQGAGGSVYIGSVHGGHVVVRLVQCLGSFVHLIGCSCHRSGMVDGITQSNG